MQVSNELRQLNRRTFLAEEQQTINGVGWEPYLRGVLAPDFIIRRGRADVPNQGVDAMINWIKAHPSTGRLVKDEETTGWMSDTLGVVICPVELESNGTHHRYQNIKVFSKEPAHAWRCVYWQVTEAPTN